MTRAKRVAQAYGLRYAGGWLHREIADELGVSASSVARWLNPEAAKANAKRANAKRSTDNIRAVCGCGAPMGPGSRYRGTKRCRACYRASLRRAASRRRRSRLKVVPRPVLNTRCACGEPLIVPGGRCGFCVEEERLAA
jgi:hypothetical protein